MDEHDDAAASQRLLDAIEELRVLERRKREEPIGSPQFLALAQQVEDQARLVFRIADAGRTTSADAPGSDDVSPRMLHRRSQQRG